MRRHNTRGAILLVTFLLMLVLAGLALAVGIFAQNSLATGRSQLMDKQAFYIAEAGWQRARQAITAGTWVGSESGTAYTESFGTGEYSVTIAANADGDEYTITSSGYVPTQSAYVARRQLVEDKVSASINNGTNYSLTATPSASSSSSGHAATSANDNDTGTYWEANTKGSGQWLKMDYGASPAPLNKIIILEKSNITGITLEYSDNDSTWSSSGVTVTKSGSTWTATFTPMAHRYFRATFTSSGATKKVSVKELQAYNATVTLATTDTDVTTSW